jgi:hypothetical protein
MAKDRVVVYPGLGSGGLKLHEPTCHHLRPSKNKPLTTSRKATPAELATLERCKVC